MSFSSVGVFASIGRLHIVAIASMGCLTFGWLFTGQRPWALAAICALDWFVVNLLNRVVDLKEDQANGITGTQLVYRFKTAFTVAGFALLGASLLLTHFWNPGLTLLRVAFHVLGFAYNWRLLPGGKRIKELYFFKNFASATGFLLTVFGYPLVQGLDFPAGVTWTTVVLTGFFFLAFELSYEAIYDLRDAEGDAQAGVRTYAVVHGEAGARRIIDGHLIGSMLILVGGFLSGLIPWRVFVMILAPAIQWYFYRSAADRGLTAADCIQMTWAGAALLAAYNGWIAAGLPGIYS